jgi:hypothetical protein
MQIAVVATTMKEVRCMFATAIVGVTVVCKKSKLSVIVGRIIITKIEGALGWKFITNFTNVISLSSESLAGHVESWLLKAVEAQSRIASTAVAVLCSYTCTKESYGMYNSY